DLRGQRPAAHRHEVTGSVAHHPRRQRRADPDRLVADPRIASLRHRPDVVALGVSGPEPCRCHRAVGRRHAHLDGGSLRRQAQPERSAADRPEGRPSHPLQLSAMDSFTIEDLDALVESVAGAWLAAADRDWSARAGTLEWTCHATAVHAIDTVIAPALFL